MSFNTAISGLKSAQSDLEVSANNIANVNTLGFKKSRTEFGDIFANSALGNSKTAIGSGVTLQSVSQQFTQGNLNFTSNNLDFGISGEGFFVLAPDLSSTERVYTRAGAFGLNEEGMVVNPTGGLLQVFPVNDDGTVVSTAISSTINLHVPDAAGTPQATSLVNLGINLPAGIASKDVTLFSPELSDTYNASTSVEIYDTLGEPHVAGLYFVRDSTAGNRWAMFTVINGETVPLDDGAGGALDYATIDFNADGTLDTASLVPDEFRTVRLGTDAALPNWLNGNDPEQQFVIDIANNTPTQFASPFTVNSLSQDGFAIGRLTGVDVNDSGVVRVSYSNGQTIAVGKIALAKFTNTQGLQQIGNTEWAQTTDSGDALAGEAGTSSFGTIRSGALELSNADLTSDLLGLITAQRNFQANAKSIETANAITQAIINIR